MKKNKEEKEVEEIPNEIIPNLPPAEIIEAAKLIESWTKRQTLRDDWAIGGVACRAGAERAATDLRDMEAVVLREIKNFKKVLTGIEKVIINRSSKK